jgi:hypothetical protein
MSRLSGLSLLSAILVATALIAPRQPASYPAPGLDPDSPVLGVSVNGVARAYPLLALFGPEVVNDELGAEPIVATF